jgi:hypothetical protein
LRAIVPTASPGTGLEEGIDHLGYPGAVIATRQRQHRRRRSVRRRDPRRLRRIAVAAAVLVVAIGVVLVVHSGSSSRDTSGIAPSQSPEIAPNAPPSPPETLATVSPLRLELPVSQQRVTAIVYHATGAANAIPLSPAGHQKNAGFFARLGERLFGSDSSKGPSYYVDGSGSGSDTGSVDVGAPAGTDVYSPVDGVVASIQPYVLNGEVRGSIIQIRPSDFAAVIVTVGNLSKHLDVDVGSPVQASVTKLGRIIDLSKLLKQTVANYTSDAGNHVSLTVSPAPGASPLL